MPCNRLASLYAAEGKMPTTPTIASIVAAVQVQEALKMLNYSAWEGRTLVSHELIFNGTVADCFRVELVRREDCLAHQPIAENKIVKLRKAKTAATTFDELMTMIERKLGSGATLELNFDMILTADCAACHEKTTILKPVGLFFQEHLACEKCGQERSLDRFHLINKKQTKVFEQIKNIKLAQLHIPPLDIFQAWSRKGEGLCFELTGDAAETIQMMT